MFLNRHPLFKRPPVANAGNLITDRVNQAGAGWTQIRNTATANVAIAPDGTKTAAKLVPNTTNNTHITYDSSNASTTVRHRAHICAKAAELTAFEFLFDNSGANTKYLHAVFDIKNGLVTKFQNASYTGYPSIEPLGNGWFLCSLVSTNALDAGVAAEFYIIPKQDPYAAFLSSWAGDDVKGIYTWGAEWYPI